MTRRLICWLAVVATLAGSIVRSLQGDRLAAIELDVLVCIGLLLIVESKGRL